MRILKYMAIISFAGLSIVSHGMDSGEGNTELARCRAASDCNAEQLKKVVTRSNVKHVCYDRKTLMLHTLPAVYQGALPDKFREANQVLVSQGANLNECVQGTGSSPFRIAVAASLDTGYFEPALILRDLGGDPFIKANPSSKSIVEELVFDEMISNQDSVRAKNAYKLARTLLENRLTSLAHAAVVCNALRIQALATPENVNTPDAHQITPLGYITHIGHLAKKKQLRDSIAALKAQGANPNNRIAPTLTYMHLAASIACSTGSLKVLKALIEVGGGDVDTQGDEGSSIQSPYQQVKAAVQRRLSPALAVYKLLEKHHNPAASQEIPDDITDVRSGEVVITVIAGPYEPSYSVPIQGQSYCLQQ